MIRRPLQLLVIDDDSIEQRILRRAFSREESAPIMHSARSGAEALEILHGTADRPALEGPVLCLLDMHMPVMNGLEFLEKLRADPRICRTPVFMLSSSASPAEVSAAYSFNVAGYLEKPGPGPPLQALVDLITNYASSVAMPPR